MNKNCFNFIGGAVLMLLFSQSILGFIGEAHNISSNSYISNWLVAGPFPNPLEENPAQGESWLKGFNHDFLLSIGGEANAVFQPGQKIEYKNFDNEKNTLEVFKASCSNKGVLDFDEIFNNPLFCPDPDTVPLIFQRLQEVKEAGDSVGGVVEIRARGCQAGLGEPVFAKLDAILAGALMGIGAVKGVEIGSGFAAADMLGSENNDSLTPDGFLSNNAGGILGGISNGDEIVARVAVKPISSIEKEQQTITVDGKPTTLSVKGRHDVSAIPRIVPVCTAMVRLVLADMFLQQKAIR